MTTNRTTTHHSLSAADRAQSETLGVLLVTTVVILAVGSFGVFYLGSVSDRADASGPLIDAEVNVTGDRISVHHVVGESVDTTDLSVLLRNDSQSERYAFDPGNVTGDADGRFEPSEEFDRAHGFASGGVLDVLVIHEPSNTVVERVRVDVAPGSGVAFDPVAAFTYGPGDPEPGDGLTFDAGGSSDADGTIASYDWTFGDGTTASGETVSHTYASTGSYDATLTVTDDDGRTDTTTVTIRVDELRAPDDPENPVNGINYQYYEADDEYPSMPNFGSETPTRTGTTDGIDLDPDHREEEFAFRFTGYVDVPQDGRYTFSTTSDDGSELYVGDERVVDNGGTHANQTAEGTIGLEAGMHEITVTMFEHGGQQGLSVSWGGEGVSNGTVPASALYRSDAPVATFAADCSGPECAFDANGSSNPGGTIASYEWDFGDGATATGQTATHAYGSNGNYTVNLTVTGDGGGTDSVERTVTATPYGPALSPGPLVQGVAYEYYEASGEYGALSEVDWSTPNRTGTTDGIDLDPDHRGDDFAFRHRAYLDVPENDTYTFYTTSDDGSVLYVDGTLVVDNRGQHPPEEQSGEIALEAGHHNVTVQYFERAGGVELSASYESSNVTRSQLPANRLYRPEQRARWETAADWDGAVGEDGVVHEPFGDHTGDAVALGYPTGGQWGPVPTAYWPLDEDAGDAAIDVVGGNDGTVEGASLGEPGTLNTTAYDFDAANEEYVGGATDLAALRGTASVSAWVNTEQTGTDTMWQSPGITGVESNGDGDDVFWGWIDEGGRVGVQAGNDPGASSTTPIDDGTWHHVVLTRDQASGEVQVYVDGTLEDTATSASGQIGTTFSSIGRIEDTGGSPEYFDGRIEDLTVHDRVLTGGEVSALHTAASEGSLTTSLRTFDVAVDPSELELTNVSVARPPGTSITVTVHSDPDGDGTFEESSAPISLDGSGSYVVDGLGNETRRVRVETSLDTPDPSATPSVDRLEIAG